LGPVDAGLDLPDPAHECVLALVEPGDVLALAGEFALALAELDVAPHRHPVADVVGQQAQPLVVAALVEQLGLAVEKIGDLLGQQEARYPPVTITHGAAPPRPSPPECGRRPESPPVPSPGPGRACTSRRPRRRAGPARRPRGPARR